MKKKLLISIVFIAAVILMYNVIYYFVSEYVTREGYRFSMIKHFLIPVGAGAAISALRCFFSGGDHSE